jgi:hypothetical protein
MQCKSYQSKVCKKQTTQLKRRRRYTRSKRIHLNIKMAGLLGGGGNNQNGGGGGLLGGLLNTVDDTTKGLPIVGGITSPLLKTVGGVTDQLPIVSLPPPLL